MVDPGLIAAGNATVAPAFKSLIEKHVLPHVDRIISKNSTNKELLRHGLQNRFEEYISRINDAYSLMCAIALGNQPRKLEDLYVPMTIAQVGEDSKKFVINDRFSEIFKKNNKIIIIDPAGMGKSTVLKYILLKCIASDYAIPILVELRKLSSSQSIINYIKHVLTEIGETVSDDFLIALMKRGDFVIMLDGYDEISPEHKTAVVADLHNFISRLPKNKYVITSRPEESLVSFSAFQSFKLKPLSKEEAYDLLRRYDAGKGRAEPLIERLEEINNSSIQEFMENPLLTSLLYRAYDHKATIPLKKHAFYRQVFDALFDAHDLSKEANFARVKKSRLDIDDFHKLMRGVGFESLRRGQLEYDKDGIINLINKAAEVSGLAGVRFDCFLDDIVKAVPLFVLDGNSYRWSHKSLQEYFAACFVWMDSREKQEIILKQMVTSGRARSYSNFFDLYYDMDKNGFRFYIVDSVLQEFKKHIENMSEVKKSKSATDDDIDQRVGLTFWHQVFLVKNKVYQKLIA